MNATPEEQLMLEDWLDGELGEQDCDALRTRLSREPALAAELTRIQSERQMRSGFWQCCEPSAEQIDSIANRVRRDCLKHKISQERLHLARNGLAVAATFAVVFASGWMGRGKMIQQEVALRPETKSTGVLPVNVSRALPNTPPADDSLPPGNVWRNSQTVDYPIDLRRLSSRRPTYKLVLVDPMGTAIDLQDFEDIRDPRKITKPFADMQSRMQNAQRPDSTMVDQLVPVDPSR